MHKLSDKPIWKLYINNKMVALESSPGSALGKLVASYLHELQFMSYDAVKLFTQNIVDMLRESGEAKKAKLSERSMAMIEYEKDESVRIVRFMYLLTDFCSNAEGLSTIHGFGMGLFERRKGGHMHRKSVTLQNPERTSMHKPFTN